MNTKHPHAEFIKAWLDGEEVEAQTPDGWSKVLHLLAFHNFGEFRFARPQWQQELIDAAKAGKVVEYLNHKGWVSSLINDISNIDNYVFHVQPLYRIRPEVPQWRKDMAKAIEDGKVVEVLLDQKWVVSNLSVGAWLDTDLSIDMQYRIKPEQKPDVALYHDLRLTGVDSDGAAHLSVQCAYKRQAQDTLKIVFDGETGKPKSVMILD